MESAHKGGGAIGGDLQGEASDALFELEDRIASGGSSDRSRKGESGQGISDDRGKKRRD